MCVRERWALDDNWRCGADNGDEDGKKQRQIALWVTRMPSDTDVTWTVTEVGARRVVFLKMWFGIENDCTALEWATRSIFYFMSLSKGGEKCNPFQHRNNLNTYLVFWIEKGKMYKRRTDRMTESWINCNNDLNHSIWFRNKQLACHIKSQSEKWADGQSDG